MTAARTNEEAAFIAAEFLDPDRLRDRLIHMGFFLLAFELLRSFAIDQTKTFFSSRWEFIGDKMKVHTSPEYDREVLSLAKYELQAVLKWHVRMAAITEIDAADILALINYRNTIAHEPNRIINNVESSYQPDAVDRVRRYHRKIGNFWGRIEVDTNPDLAGQEIDFEGIVSGTTALLDFMAFSLSEPKSKK